MKLNVLLAACILAAFSQNGYANERKADGRDTASEQVMRSQKAREQREQALSKQLESDLHQEQKEAQAREQREKALEQIFAEQGDSKN